MENLFSSASSHSANFDVELAKLQGADPSFKVFFEPKSFSVDSLVDWNLGTFNNVVSGTLGTYGTNGNIQLQYGTWQKTTNMDVLPGSDGWTYDGNGVESDYNSVGGGSLTINTIGAGTNRAWYEIATAFNGTLGYVVEWNMKVGTITGAINRQLSVEIYDGDKREQFYFSGTSVTRLGGDIYGVTTTDNNHKYTFVSKSNAYILYMDDVAIFNVVNMTFGAGGANLIYFGDINNTDGNSLSYWDYMKYTNVNNFIPQLGTYTSKIYDSGFNSNFKQLNFAELLNGGTTQYQFRTGTDQSSCDVASWKAVVSGTRPAIEDGEYYQFRIALTGDGTTSPIVDKVQGTTQFSLENKLIIAPEISRSLERLFQETQISSVGLNVDNADDTFNPLGTGLFAVSTVYNKPIEIWKGFKYGWNGSTWGTAEYVPAWTGFIDNIAMDSNGRAVINARDKGKLFYNNTSEDCTQTGTAGGAYWTSERISDNVEHLLEQSVNYGENYTDFIAQRTYLISQQGIKDVTIFEKPILTYGVNSFAFNTGTLRLFLEGYHYDYDDFKGTFVFRKNGITPASAFDVQGTTYLLNSNNIYSHTFGDNGTTTLITNTLQLPVFNGYSKVFSKTGTRLAWYDVITGSSGTNNMVFPINSGNELAVTRLIPGRDNVFCLIDMLGTQLRVYKHSVTAGTGVEIGTIVGYSQDLAVADFGIVNDNTDTIHLNLVGTGAGRPRYTAKLSGANYNTVSILGTGNTFGRYLYTGTTDDKIYFVKNIEFSFPNNGTSYLYCYDGTNANSVGTVGYGTGLPLGKVYSFPEYYSYGTRPSRIIVPNLAEYGTTQKYMYQYSSEYNLTLSSFDVGNAGKVADVLQSLAEASNYVQYIDEGGVYYFRRRDSGTTIDYTFGTNDIVAINIQEGEGISQSPIFNKGVWGTNTGTVSYEDLPSQGTYGLQAYTLNNKWIISPVVANDVLYGIVNDNKQPKAVISAKLRYYPVVKLFDVVGIDYSRLNLSGTKPWQVVGMSENNSNTVLTLKEI